MKTHATSPRFSSKRGAALMTALLFTFVLVTLSAAILSWSNTEARINRAHIDRTTARQTAEALAEFASAQAGLQARSATDYDPTFCKLGTPNALQLPDASFFAGTRIDPAHLEVVAQITPPATGVMEDFATTNDSRNDKYSLKVVGARAQIEILTRASTLPDSQGNRQSIYLRKTASIVDEPVFQYAAFFNMDLEIAPGPDFNIYGPVHTNGNLWLSKQGNATSYLRFWSNVSSSGKLFKGYKVEPIQAPGTREASRNNPLIEFRNMTGTGGTHKALWGSWNGNNMWRDQIRITDDTEFVNCMTQTYGTGQTAIRTAAHGIGRRALPGELGTYVAETDPTNTTIEGTYRNIPRALIERPLFPGDVEYIGPEVEKQKMSRKAGLYILVNATDFRRPARAPNGVVIAGGLGAREYRAWVRRGTTYSEVKLPGQPTQGANLGQTWFRANGEPNYNAALPVRPLIRIVENAMYDLRRFRNFNPNQPRSTPANVYDPKEINLIEVDMTVLKLAVDHTVNGAAQTMIFPYDTDDPAVVSENALRPNGMPNPYFYNYGAIYNGVINEYGVNNGTRLGLYSHVDDRYLIEGMTPNDWDGSIYIESLDADFVNMAFPTPGPTTDDSPALPGFPGTGVPSVTNLTWTVEPTGASWSRRRPGHRESGVRLINGRGPVASANDARVNNLSFPCRYGVTLSTNDALYILGHLNADGRIFSSNIPPTNAQLTNVNTLDDAGNGNNSSLFRDPLIRAGATREQPLALVADAITILSQPVYGAVPRGWRDSRSRYAKSVKAGDWIDTWPSTPPSSDNENDGSANNTQVKWQAADTEISAGFITGITPSANSPADPEYDDSTGDGNNSGGLHNLPRFLENWGTDTNVNPNTPTVTCAIRGSMVVMFESKVAWEPWSLRVYAPPTRLWGFHNFFGNFLFSDDIPAVRQIGTTFRDSFEPLTRDQYLARRTAMWGTDYTTTPPP